MFRVVFQAVMAAVGALATVTLTAIQVKAYHPETDAPIYASLALLGLMSFVVPVRRSIQAYRLSRSDTFREGARTALGTALIQLVRLPGINVSDVGVSAFIVQRRLRFPWVRHLERVGRVRLSSVPGDTCILWTRSRGLLGRCWQQKNIVVAETADSFAPYVGIEDRRSWQTQVPEDVRLGLSLRQFKAIREKFREVIVVPIIRDNRFYGCVAVDTRFTAPVDVLYQNRLEVVEAASNAAITIGNQLALLNRWIYTRG